MATFTSVLDNPAVSATVVLAVVAFIVIFGRAGKGNNA